MERGSPPGRTPFPNSGPRCTLGEWAIWPPVKRGVYLTFDVPVDNLLPGVLADAFRVRIANTLWVPESSQHTSPARILIVCHNGGASPVPGDNQCEYDASPAVIVASGSGVPAAAFTASLSPLA